MIQTPLPHLAVAVFLVFLDTDPAIGIAGHNPYLLGIANALQDAPDDDESVKKAEEELAKLREIKKRLDDRRSQQDSPSLLSLIFSSPLGIAGLILLFFVAFSIVYYTLKKHESSKGG